MGITKISQSRLADDAGTKSIAELIVDELDAIRRSLGSAAGSGAGMLAGSEVYDAASLSDGVGATSTGATVTGAALGDLVIGSYGVDLQGITATYYVSATDTCKCRLQNESGGTIDLASTTIRYRVIPLASIALPARLLTKS
jgi:hypothetical protein